MEFDEKMTILLKKTAELNNQGIKYEKAGKIKEAVEVYEENVSLGYLASHSYNRLMVIYSRNGDYYNEIRIIKTAIQNYSRDKERHINILSKWKERLKKVTDKISKLK